MSDPALDAAAGRWLRDGTKRIPEIGDGDPREYGGTLPDGRRWSHPPYGPARIDRPNPFLAAGPPEDAWPDFARLGYAVAKFRAMWWLTVGDLFWRVGLTRMAGWLYQLAVRAERDADGIAKRVREFYEDDESGRTA